MIKTDKIQHNKYNCSFKGWKVGAKAGKFLEYVGKHIDTPEQRLAIGGTALILHPIIDLTNKKVDKKTRETAAARSIARAVFGTISGIAVRSGCINIGEYLVRSKNKFVNIDALKTASEKNIKNYASSIGNILALLVMLVTNFTFDMPLINKYQDIINDKVFGHKQESKEGAKNE